MFPASGDSPLARQVRLVNITRGNVSFRTRDGRSELLRCIVCNSYATRFEFRLSATRLFDVLLNLGGIKLTFVFTNETAFTFHMIVNDRSGTTHSESRWQQRIVMQPQAGFDLRCEFVSEI